jgi:glucokinase
MLIYNDNKIVSIDLGGTWIRAATVSTNGNCGAVFRKPTERFRPAEKILEDIVEVISRAGADGFDAVGVGIPTVLDGRGGLNPCDNLPTMGGIDLAEHLQTRLNVPVKLFNDATCFTMGEWWMGAGKGTRNFCGVTLGTGIGLGLIVNGILHTGSHGCAGEIWKTPYETRMLEDEVCGKAIIRNFKKLSGKNLEGEIIADMARQGDADAIKVFREFGNALGRVMAFIVNTLDPEMVAFGGSVARSFDLFGDNLKETVLAGTVSGAKVMLIRSELGESAGLFGAAKLYWEKTHE